MLTTYPACFFKEESGYSVIFPDLNWLSTCGATLDEAIAAAIDCLAGYLYACKRDGDAVSAPSAMIDIHPASIAQELGLESEETFVNLVTVDVAQYAKTHFEKPVKKTLSIPAWLNAAALEKHINFSQTLQEALIAKLRA